MLVCFCGLDIGRVALIPINLYCCLLPFYYYEFRLYSFFYILNSLKNEIKLILFFDIYKPFV